MIYYSNQIDFRPMTLADLKQVIDIERRAYTAPWSEGAYRYELQAFSNSHYIVAMMGNTMVGYCGYKLKGMVAHIMTIAIDPNYHRKGYGDSLLRYTLDHMKKMGAIKTTLEVRVSNMGAQRLYARYGFQQVGTKRCFYPDNREDALVMELNLNF